MVLVMLPDGSIVMADKGFLIEDLCEQHKHRLLIPPLASTKFNFTTQQLMYNRDVASQRIHVERAIQRANINKILSGTMPLSRLPLIGDIVYNCFALVNLSTPIVKQAAQ
jgi:hypothetical protein